jgi:hypothetical protein
MYKFDFVNVKCSILHCASHVPNQIGVPLNLYRMGTVIPSASRPATPEPYAAPTDEDLIAKHYPTASPHTSIDAVTGAAAALQRDQKERDEKLRQNQHIREQREHWLGRLNEAERQAFDEYTELQSDQDPLLYHIDSQGNIYCWNCIEYLVNMVSPMQPQLRVPKTYDGYRHLWSVLFALNRIKNFHFQFQAGRVYSQLDIPALKMFWPQETSLEMKEYDRIQTMVVALNFPPPVTFAEKINAAKQQKFLDTELAKKLTPLIGNGNIHEFFQKIQTVIRANAHSIELELRRHYEGISEQIRRDKLDFGSILVNLAFLQKQYEAKGQIPPPELLSMAIEKAIRDSQKTIADAMEQGGAAAAAAPTFRPAGFAADAITSTPAASPAKGAGLHRQDTLFERPDPAVPAPLPPTTPPPHMLDQQPREQQQHEVGAPAPAPAPTVGSIEGTIRTYLGTVGSERQENELKEIEGKLRKFHALHCCKQDACECADWIAKKISVCIIHVPENDERDPLLGNPRPQPRAINDRPNNDRLNGVERAENHKRREMRLVANYRQRWFWFSVAVSVIVGVPAALLAAGIIPNSWVQDPFRF